MKLHHLKTSPFARKVMMVAHEAGIVDRISLITSDPLASPPALLAANPLGKVPCLILDDGSTLFDSRVICEYLDLSFNEGRLFPTDPATRVPALRWQAMGDGVSDAAVLCRYERQRPEAARSDEWIARQEGKITRALDVLEEEVAALAAAPVAIGHLTIAAALGYLDLRLEALRWRDGRPRLAAWYSAIRERPSVGRTDPIALP